MSYTDHVKNQVDALLQARGLKVAQLVKGIDMSTSTFYDMWRNGTVTVDRLLAIAKFFDVRPSELLPNFRNSGNPVVEEPVATYQGNPPTRYIEDRITHLETELRKLKTKISNL